MMLPMGGSKQRLADSEITTPSLRKRRHKAGDHGMCNPGWCEHVGREEQRERARERARALHAKRAATPPRPAESKQQKLPNTPMGEQIQLIRWLVEEHGGRELVRLPGRHPASHTWQVPTRRGRVSIVACYGSGKGMSPWWVTGYRFTPSGCRSFIGPRMETAGLAVAVEDRLLRALAPDGPATRLAVSVPLRVEIDTG